MTERDSEEHVEKLLRSVPLGRGEHESERRRLYTGLALANQSKQKAAEAGKVLESVDPRLLRKRACLVIRCSDCASLTIAYVVWYQRRPVLFSRPRGGGDRWNPHYLDEPDLPAG